MGFYNKYIFLSNSYLQNYVVRDTVKKHNKSVNLEMSIDRSLIEVISERNKYINKGNIKKKLACLQKTINRYHCKNITNKCEKNVTTEKCVLNKLTNTDIKKFNEVSINTSPKKLSNVCTNTSPVMSNKICESLKVIVREENNKNNKNYYNNKAKASIGDRINLNKN